MYTRQQVGPTYSKCAQYMLSILLSSPLNRVKSNYGLTSQRRSGSFALAATALAYHKLEQACNPLSPIDFLRSSQLPTIDSRHRKNVVVWSM